MTRTLLCLTLWLLPACSAAWKAPEPSRLPGDHDAITAADAARPPEDGMTREEMYRSLSSHQWCNEPTVASDSATPAEAIRPSSLELRPDGTYEKSLLTDYIEAPPPSPLWNFEKLGGRDGVLYLVEQERLLFVLFDFLSADQLQVTGLFPGELRRQQFHRCQPLKGEGAHTLADLPRIDLGKQVEQLAGTSWSIAGEASYEPRSVRFEPNGTALVQLTAAQCALPDDETSYLGNIVKRMSEGGCWKQLAFDPGSYRLSSRFLVHRYTTPYLREKDRSTCRYVWLSFESARVDGVISYDPPFWQTPRQLTLELWGRTEGQRIAGRLTIEQRVAVEPKLEYQDLAVVQFEGVSLAARPVVRQITIDPFTGHTQSAWLSVSYQAPGVHKDFPVNVYFPP